MDRAHDIAGTLAVSVLMLSFGALLFFTAPRTAAFQCRLTRRPLYGVYWKFTLWWMRAWGTAVIAATLVTVFMVMFGQW